MVNCINRRNIFVTGIKKHGPNYAGTVMSMLALQYPQINMDRYQK